MRYLKYSIFIFFGILLLSCGSKTEDPKPIAEGFIRFKVNGVQKEFKTNPVTPMSFSFDSNGPVHNAILQVLGPGSTGTSNFIQFNVWNEKTFELNVDYQMQQAIAYRGVGIARINFTYADEQGQVFNAVLLKQNLPSIVVKNDATVRFTKITKDWAEGTFTAILIGPVTTSGIGNQERIISEGQFSIKLVNLTP
ncbi:hypothetical protein [Algoriphagus sp.]|uniref:hypothetical protein n=1 Tax=Algoriphagus sp. TaxID=1872435 RepID=UPI00272FF05F|nr:hypothetical protein [Algoriphagus sp.]MDP2041705.1 hypothetical protein [Algoriphagus sp.]